MDPKTMSIDQVEARLKEIRALIDSNEKCDVDALNAEVDALQARAAELRGDEAKRRELRTRVASGEIGGTPQPVVNPDAPKARKYNADSEEYRSAWLKNMASFSDKNGTVIRLLGDLNEEERTAFTYTTSNTGSVVPTAVLNRIVELVESMSPLYDDSTQSGMAQGFGVPRHKTIEQGDAAVTNEGVANEDEEDTFDLLALTGVEIKKHVKITRKMSWQSIPAFEDWLVKHISERIAVAKETRILTQLSNATYGIAAANVLTGQAYTDSNIRGILALIHGQGAKVWYANRKTIFNGLAGITDKNGRPLFLADTTGSDPTVAGRIYGGIVKLDENVPDNVVYVGIPRLLLTNDFEALFIGRDTDMTTFVTTIGGYSLFDAGLENPLAFVKATFADTTTPFVSIPSTATVAKDDTVTIPVQAVNPVGTSVTFTSGTPAKATVDSTTGVVTGVAAGTSVITATITVGGQTYTDTCTVTVTA